MLMRIKDCLGATRPAEVPPKPPAAEEEKKDDEGSPEVKLEGLSAILLGVTALVAAIAALSATGTLGRVQRDSPEVLTCALLLLIAAGAVWMVVPLVKGENSPRWFEIAVRLVTVGAAAVAFFIALNAAVGTADHEPRPQVSADLNAERTVLKAHVTTSSMKTDHRLAFRVDLLKERENVLPIYRAYVGPNSDGNIDQTIEIFLPEVEYDQISVRAFTGTTSPACGDYEKVVVNAVIGPGTGCVLITLPLVKPAPPPVTQSKGKGKGEKTDKGKGGS
jgi:hypothetical protein